MKTNSKLKFTSSLILMVSCVIFGAVLTVLTSKIKTLNKIETALNSKIKDMESMEIKINRLSQSFKRKRREARHGINDTNDGHLNDIQLDRNNDRSTCTTKCSQYGGATYIRWGRKNCSDESETIYEGVVGGSLFSHEGGAVDSLCLPKFPLWNRYIDGYQDQSLLYGSEYQGQSDSLFSLTNSRKLTNENMPCAVCRSKKRQSVIMLPARNVCYQGWTLEYHGYLMAGIFSHKKGSMYICVDEAPEVTESGYRSEGGNYFYAVEGRCGSLPCPEYIDGREITCAVCTK